MIRRVCCIMSLLVFLCSGAYSQLHNISFERISIEQGLSQSTVSSIVQDSLGYMWFATNEGLNRYDGNNFVNFRYNPKIPKSLPENNITTLFVDRYGTLWVGTASRGLCKYNQSLNSFENFRNNPMDDKTISADGITAIYQDKAGFIWVGTKNGLNRYDPRRRNFKRYLPNPLDNSSVSSNKINHITGDRLGNLWVSTDYGLNRFNVYREVFFAYVNRRNVLNKISDNVVNAALVDTGNVVWVATQRGLNKLDLRTNKFEYFFNDPQDVKSISANNVTSLLKDKDGLIWIGTINGGLNCFNPKTKTFKAFLYDPGNSKSLSVNSILDLYTDRSGVLWIGTFLGGINKWNRMSEGLETYRNNPYDVTSINTNQVQSFYEDSVGNVWIGTVDGGLNFWERNFNTFVHYAEVPDDSTSLNNMHVTSILRDSENKIFIGTDGGGLNIFEESKGRFVHVLNTLRTPNAIPGNEIRKIIEDKQGFIWIGTFDGGLCRYNRTIHKMTFFRHNSEQQSSIGSNKVTDVLEDNEGNIWVGTYDAGISKLKKGRNSFTHFRSDLHNKHAICDNRIHAIFNDRQGRIWIGTGNGLAKYNPKTDDFTCYNDENGLRSNAIVGITQDKNNNIWLGTVNGLIRFNPTTTSSKNYDVRDGLQSNEFLARSAFACKDGMLLFGGVNGFNSFYPDKLKENLIVPKIAITNFLVNNAAFQTDTNISIVKRIVLQHDQNTFSFNFAAFSYVFSEKNQYAFKMEGLDKDWNYVKNMRYAQYSKLSPDKYVFRVKGSNNDGHWNEQGVAIEIIIKPAFWQTMWFKFLIALLAGLGIYAGFRYRLQRIEAQKIHLEELVTLRTKEIELQKEEIETQRDEIQSKSDEIIAQRDDMEQQRDQISVKNREIRSSIVYAERIQRATLPEQHTIPNSLADFFVFFQPKDIVSGDFYWVGEQKGWVILVAADCTGHGVPGAFMSMLGTSFLNKIVNEKGHTHPSQILNKLRQNVIDALHQRGEINEARDGMDIAICSYNPSKRVIQFSGANNPLYRVRDGESEIFKGDKMPIAIYEEMHPFTQIELQVQPGDAFYIFSDGYADQFGGTFNKKFKYKPFRELLTIHAHRPMLEQKQVLIDTFEDWRGVNEQVDDIIVMGFTI